MNHSERIAELQQAVYELSCTFPHEPPDQRLGRAEHRIYWQGYYYALQMALRVMSATIERQQTRDQAPAVERRDRGAA